MAKRFIDTEIFKKRDIRALKGANKLLYVYMFCECNHAGIWEVEMDVTSIRLGFDYNEKSVLEAFGDKVHKISPDRWYLTEFVMFQYGVLNPENRAHKSVIDLLKKYHLRGLTSPSKGRKDMDMDKEKVLDKDKEKEYQSRIGAMKGRRPSTLWSKKEIQLLRVIGEIEEEDMVLLEKYYSAEIKDRDIRRTSIAILLNNWPGELDRARNFNPPPTHQQKDWSREF